MSIENDMLPIVNVTECEGEARPLHEVNLLHHMDNLLHFLQYDCVTNEEWISAYNAAIAIMFMFLNNNRLIPQHFVEWLMELRNESIYLNGGAQNEKI